MGSRTYLPRTLWGLYYWLCNFIEKLPGRAAQFRLSSDEVASVVALATRLRDALKAHLDAMAAARAATEQFNLVFQEVMSGIRGLRNFIQRLKTSEEYTPEAGQDLGIIGRLSQPEYDSLKPALKTEVFPGEIQINFKKGEMSAVSLFSRRGTETSFTFLATAISSPYKDRRPNLIAGQPEQREYYGIYQLGNDNVGQLSDITKVTSQTNVPVTA